MQPEKGEMHVPTISCETLAFCLRNIKPTNDPTAWGLWVALVDRLAMNVALAACAGEGPFDRRAFLKTCGMEHLTFNDTTDSWVCDPEVI